MSKRAGLRDKTDIIQNGKPSQTCLSACQNHRHRAFVTFEIFIHSTNEQYFNVVG